MLQPRDNYLRPAPLYLSDAYQPATGSTGYRLAKRTIDLAVAAISVLFLLPVFLVVAVAIRADSRGPIIFRQERVGQGEKTFRIFKFRTMRWPTDDKIHLDHVNGGGRQLKLVDDPRITRVGHWLRRWSLDELPNLLNVIGGSMSLVGPRPLVPYEAFAPGWYSPHRFKVKPGVTGMAQVAGRLSVGHHERADIDLTYVQQCSLMLDLSIMVRTPIALLLFPG